MTRTLKAALAAAAALLCAMPAGATGYTFSLLGDRPFAAPGQTYATGINNSGTVVGYSGDPGLNITSFTYSNGVFDVAIPTFPFDYAGSDTVLGISNDGKMVGYYVAGEATPFGPRYRYVPFEYDGGQFTLLPPGPNAIDPNNLGVGPFGVNISGQIAGDYVDAGWNNHGLLYSGGAYTVLDYPGTGVPGSMIDNTQAFGINDLGEVVGCYDGPGAGFNGHAFTYTGGVYASLTVAGARDTCASGVNNHGAVAGTYFDDLSYWGTHHGFVFENGVYQLVDDSGLPGGVQDAFITGINDLGQLSGYYYDDTFAVHSFIASPDLAAPAPEPAAWMLMLTGFGLAGVRLRRQARGSGVVANT